jgi:hypothetical protein
MVNAIHDILEFFVAFIVYWHEIIIGVVDGAPRPVENGVSFSVIFHNDDFAIRNGHVIDHTFQPVNAINILGFSRIGIVVYARSYNKINHVYACV